MLPLEQNKLLHSTNLKNMKSTNIDFIYNIQTYKTVSNEVTK